MKKPIKKCSCGREYFELPEDAKFFLDPGFDLTTGYWWDCQCKSSLFLPMKKYIDLTLEAA